MTSCLYCHETIAGSVKWGNIFQHEGDRLLCHACYENLKPILNNHCLKCYKANEVKLCSDCEQWSLSSDGQDYLSRNVSLYEYNDWVKDFITQWKYRGDYVLGETFKRSFQEVFLREFKTIMKDSVLVPIPLSKERLFERGFNQASQLASFIVEYKVEQEDILYRRTNERQSKKTREERLGMKNPFYIKNKINKSVILVDDIYTTGQTLRHAAKLLKKYGCPEVYSCTLVRS